MRRLTVGDVRTWVGKLHVGQLVVLLVGIAIVGGAFMLISNWTFQSANDLDPRLSILALDSAKKAALSQTAEDLRSRGGRLGIMALVVWSSAFPILWSWFGARRRPLT